MKKLYPLLSVIFLIYWGCEEEQDTTPPTVTITFPQNNSSVSEMVTITCISSDNEGVEKVELWVNGVTTGLTDDTEPYSLVWNTINDGGLTWNSYSQVDNGTYTITVRSYDTSGNTVDSESIILIVNNIFTNYFNIYGNWERREYSSDGGITWGSFSDDGEVVVQLEFYEDNVGIMNCRLGNNGFGYHFSICENIIHYSTTGTIDALNQYILDNNCPCDSVDNGINTIGDPGSYYLEKEDSDVMIWKQCANSSGFPMIYKFYRE